MQEDPYLAPIFQKRLAAAYFLAEDETGSATDLSETDMDMAADGSSSLEKHKHKHKHHKKKKKKDHPCDYLEGLSSSVVRFGASSGDYTRITAGNNTCYEAVRGLFLTLPQVPCKLRLCTLRLQGLMSH